MRTITTTVGPLVAASATAIALAQTPGGTGVINLTGTTAGVLDKPRRVLVTTAADESAKTLTIVGTDWNGNRITETMTGPNASTAYTNYDFATVTSATLSAAGAGNISLGTNGVASSRPVRLDPWAGAQVALAVDVVGTVNYTVQQTLDDPNDQANPVGYSSITWINHADTALVSATTALQGNYGYTPSWTRVTLNSGTGSIAMKVNQTGGPIR